MQHAGNDFRPHGIEFLDNDQNLYWATVRYSRHWISSDGPESQEVRLNEMTPYMLRKIAIRYNVMRGIKGKAKDDDQDTKAQRKLCQILNRAARRWPKTFLGRSRACIRIARKAREAECFGNNQVSAVTKFMWFLNPDDWTVFDKFAANGYNKFCKKGYKLPSNDNVKKMLFFYRSLQDRGIPSIWTKMQNVIDNSELPGFPATRIFDSFLMDKGRRENAEQSNRIAKFSMSLLPEATALVIHNLAMKLQAEFGAVIEEKLNAEISARLSKALRRARARQE